MNTSMLFDIAIKSVVLAGLGLVAILAARKTSSSYRHAFLLSVMVALLVFPLLLVFGPTWKVAILAPKQETSSTASSAIAHVSESSHPIAQEFRATGRGENPIELRTQERMPLVVTLPLKSEASAHRKISPIIIVVSAWGMGFFVSLIPMILARVVLNKISASAQPVSQASLLSTFNDCCRELGMKSKPALKQANFEIMPMVWRLRRPVILLPPKFGEWPEARIRAVLMHELAHIVRRDCLTQVLARFTCAIYWFNPFAWLIERQLVKEREQACDDMVIKTGTEPIDYAEHLLHIALFFKPASLVGAGAVTMARQSQIESRLKAVLEKGRKRQQVARRLVAACVVITVIGTLALAVLKPVARAQSVKASSEGIKTSQDAKIEAPVIKTTSTNVIRLRVVLKQTGESLAGVPFTVKFGNSWEPGGPEAHVTGSDGTYDIVIPTPAPVLVHVKVRKPGYGAMYVAWFRNPQLGGFPNEYTMAIEPGQKLGGKIIDADGKPVVGALVRVTPSDNKPLPSPTSHSPAREWDDEQITDSAGAWQTSAMPQRLPQCWVQVFHSNYNYLRLTVDEGSALLTALKKGAGEIKIEHGVEIRGRVINSAGVGISGINVYEGVRDNVDSAKTKTEGDGSFKFDRTFKEGSLKLTVDEKGYAPSIKTFALGMPVQNVEIQLKTGALLKGRVVNTKGEPIRGVQVQAGGSSSGSRTPDPFAIQRQFSTDADGRFSWNDAPDGSVLFSFYHKDFRSERDLNLTVSEKEATITLKPGVHLKGLVTDATTGEPIPAFTISMGTPSGPSVIWSYNEEYRRFTNGVMEVIFTEPALIGGPRPSKYIVRVQARGYEPVVSKEISEEEQEKVWNVALKPAVPLRGVVLNSLGGRISDARIVVVSSPGNLGIEDGKLKPSGPLTEIPSKADGTFDLGTQIAETPVVIIHELDGFLKTTFGEMRRNTNVVLNAWGIVVGTLQSGTKPVTNSDISLDFNEDPDKVGWRITYKTKTDARGNFRFERVPAGIVRLARWVSLGNGSQQLMRFGPVIQVKPAEMTANIVLGENGRHITGKLSVENRNPPLAWTNAVGYISAIIGQAPPLPAGLDNNQQRQWYMAWYATDAGRKFKKEVEIHSGVTPLIVHPDGSFETDIFFTGKNSIAVKMYKPQDPISFNAASRMALPIVEANLVLEIPDGTDTYDVGTIVLRPSQNAPRANGGIGSKEALIAEINRMSASSASTTAGTELIRMK